MQTGSSSLVTILFFKSKRFARAVNNCNHFFNTKPHKVHHKVAQRPDPGKHPCAPLCVLFRLCVKIPEQDLLSRKFLRQFQNGSGFIISANQSNPRHQRSNRCGQTDLGIGAAGIDRPAILFLLYLCLKLAKCQNFTNISD